MKSQTYDTAIFAAGCFWGVESAFAAIDGVINTEVGYCGGNTIRPTYNEVCTGNTGHAEVVRLTFDLQKVTFAELLDTFQKIHNPASLNKQGPDYGTQYRSAIFCTNDQQLSIARNTIKIWDASEQYTSPVVTEVKTAGLFYRAEEYHQKYHEKNGITGCSL